MATVLDITANANALTTIGKVGENQYKRILFPIANWLALYPGATCELVHRRATDGGGYPVLNITTDANYLYWTVESGDCAVAGIGAAEVVIKSGDSIAKSVIYPTQVLPSVVDTEVPPTPWEDYISRIYNYDITSVQVAGTTPVISAEANTRYMCGEVTSLSFTPPTNGTAEVFFTSGATPTTLTLPQTVKMPDWFVMEANRIYEISITDGIYGAVMSWAL